MPNERDLPPEENETELNRQDDSERQVDFAKKMQAIASDLWGAVSGNAEFPGGRNQTGRTVNSEPQGHPAVDQRKGKAPAQAVGKKAELQRDPKQGIRHLWQTADETVDWTEALGHETSPDGLTDAGSWRLYHRLAPKVLTGDLDAYVEVLTTTNPLGDLTDYVNGMVIRTPSADRLECRFECRKDLMEEDAACYLCALGLRIARDLLAVLPVNEVYVEGNLEGERKLGVIYPRQKLLKRNPLFIDPVAFAEECGGVMEA